MITAIVKYQLPPSIDLDSCREHFHRIAPDFKTVPGLISKHFICAEDAKTAGGVYQWESQAAAESFYNGPWREGIVNRYGMTPEISYFHVLAMTDNLQDDIKFFSDHT